MPKIAEAMKPTDIPRALLTLLFASIPTVILYISNLAVQQEKIEQLERSYRQHSIREHPTTNSIRMDERHENTQDNRIRSLENRLNSIRNER